MASEQVDYSNYVMPCEVYSRIVGYLRPVQNWSKHKQDEFKKRNLYVVPSASKLDTLSPIPQAQEAR